MIVAFYIFVTMVAVGTLLYIHHRIVYGKTPSPADDPTSPSPADDPQCCGMHISCEKDSLLTSLSTDIVYYDDEELDRFAGRDASLYTDTEIEEFREVLLSLLPDDIAGWGRSIQLRGITLPGAIRDELFMIISEAREARTA